MSIHQTLKKPWFRMVMDEKPHRAPEREVLRDGDTSFGQTEASEAEKRRLREREKKRRQRARAMISIASAPPLVPEYQLGVFEVSGIKAYRSTHDGIAVSLPYVSILGGSHV